MSLLFTVLLSTLAGLSVLFSSASESGIQRYVVVVNAIPPTDDSMTNSDYAWLNYHWYSTISLYVNPTNSYGFSPSAVVSKVTTSANTWDVQTSYLVFSYKGTVTRGAGVRDGYNVVSWGMHSQANVIAVTFILARGKRIVETDCLMNVNFAWSLTGEAGKMDVQT